MPSGHQKPKARPSSTRRLSRRSSLKAMGVTASAALLSRPSRSDAQSAPSAANPQFKIRHGRIRQSIMGWTFNPMPTAELARLCKDIGLVAMEGIDRKDYPMVRELGLEISLVGSHGFSKGPVNRANHSAVAKALREGIDTAVQFSCNKIITFTGMREAGISDAQAIKNCVECWKEVIPYAEEKGVTLCLEHLNSRDNTHPMKGHPGYFGDDIELCVDLIRKVASPRFKLLFDIYHVQIMHGDVIRHLQTHREHIAHYHTAGVPGRGELDDTQEVNYPAILRAILETGYTGFVAQEFIPTWKDKALALRHAAQVCDV